MSICYQFGLNFRYQYNASKSAVLVINEKSNEFKSTTRTWSLGDSMVADKETYKHLGITLNKYLNRSINVEECCQKIRSIFLSLVHCGLFGDGLHPLSAKKIYESIVLPKALYGCEFWDNLNKDDVYLLEKSHMYCLKYLQSISKYTSTDIASSLIGMLPISAEIDIRKLVFFGQLCRLESCLLVKSIFSRRVISYTNNPSRVRGFIAESFKLFYKYNLGHIIKVFTNEGVFPSKNVWKNMVKQHVNMYFSNNLYMRVTENSTFTLYSLLHQQFYQFIPADIWVLSKQNRRLIPVCKVIAQMISSFFSTFSTTCNKCGVFTNQKVVHLMFFCAENVLHTEELLDIIYVNYKTMFKNLMKCTIAEQVIQILSGFGHLLSPNEKMIFFQINCKKTD